MTGKREPPQVSKREQLLGRKLPEVAVRIRVADADVLDAAQVDLDAAKRAGTTKVRETAQAALDACYVEVRFRALPQLVYDELVAAHKPPDEQARTHAFNARTFPAALLGEACTDPDFDEAFWGEFGKTAAGPGEFSQVYFAVDALHQRPLDVRVGKGSTPTPN